MAQEDPFKEIAEVETPQGEVEDYIAEGMKFLRIFSSLV